MGKLTRAEACAELAKRMGWRNVKWKGVADLFIATSPSGKEVALPNFFTSRDAAAELVAWIVRKSGSASLIERFNAAIQQAAFFEAGNQTLAIGALLLSPESITLAACAALNIELEDAPQTPKPAP